jgi:hypothetical protein
MRKAAIMLTVLMLVFPVFGCMHKPVRMDFHDRVSVLDLKSMTQTELNILYARSTAADIPAGTADGIAIWYPDFWFSGVRTFLSSLVWKGKEITPLEGVPGKADLVNRLTLWNAVRAEVYVAPSIYDGQPAVILDYNKTSFFFKPIWDEIRLVGPDLWLGRSYVRTWYGDYLMVNFILDFSRKGV